MTRHTGGLLFPKRPWPRLLERSSGVNAICTCRRALSTSRPRLQDAGTSPASKSNAPPRLAAPSSAWSWSEDDLRDAAREVQLRKAAFDSKDFDDLRELRTRSKEVQALIGKAAVRQKELEAQLREARRAAKGKQKEDPNDDAGAHAPTQDPQAVQNEAAKQREHTKKLSSEQAEITARSLQLRLQFPNRTHKDVPSGPERNARILGIGGPHGLLPTSAQSAVGKSLHEADDKTTAEEGHDHLAVAEQLSGSYGGIDRRSGVLATGPSWPYLLGRMSMLEHALAQYALSVAAQRGYIVVSPPEVVKTDIAARCGFNPRDEKASQTYHVTAQLDKDVDTQEGGEFCLVGTAEISIAALLAGRTFPAPRDGDQDSASTAPTIGLDSLSKQNLPLRLVALSHSFRAEAGARGTDTRGLYRVHQFSKAELFIVCSASQSEAMLEELRHVQEHIISSLGLPYRVLDMPSEELGASAYRKYDIEVWMPGRGSWGEVSSASNCTDYQARRLHIKHKTRGAESGGKAEFAHTLNGTAAAVPRLIVALLEAYGVGKDNKLRLPQSLKPFWLAGEDAAHVEWLPDAQEKAVNSVGSPPGVRAYSTSTRSVQRRAYSTSSPSPKPSVLKSAIQRVRALAERTGTDPGSLVLSFLILHEITATLPLLLLFYIFTSFGIGAGVLQWLLPAETTQVGSKEDDAVKVQHVEERYWLTAKLQGWLEEGMKRAERYGRRKGYFGFEKGSQDESGQQQAFGKTILAGAFADAVAAYVVVKVSCLLVYF